MTEELNLSPCPFCGSQAVLHDRAGWEIDCSNDECCAHMVLLGPEKEPLVAAWNRRTHQPAESSGKAIAWKYRALTGNGEWRVTLNEEWARSINGNVDVIELVERQPAESAGMPHEMTPEMMRAVQINSELGAYACANLSGAYDLFREFWHVAMKAAPQSESADPEFAAMVEAGTKAWANVPKASEWVDELRGGDEGAGQLTDEVSFTADETRTLLRQWGDARGLLREIHATIADGLKSGRLIGEPEWMGRLRAYLVGDKCTVVNEGRLTDEQIDQLLAEVMPRTRSNRAYRNFARAIERAVRAQADGDMDKREAVARAICASCDENPDHKGDANGNAHRWQDYLHVADAAIKAAQAPGDVEYELHQDDMMVAGASGKNAWQEIQHYAAQYEQDGPFEIYEVTRRKVTPTKAEGAQG